MGVKLSHVVNVYNWVFFSYRLFKQKYINDIYVVKPCNCFEIAPEVATCW